MPPTDIRDVKPPVDFPSQFNLIYLIIAILFLVGILCAFYFLKKRKKNPKPVEINIKSPRELALEQLEALLKENLPAQRKLNPYYSKLSNIVRYYFEGQFHIKAPEMTTEEFLIFLRTSGKLSETDKNLLKDFLTSCDMVKFAKYAPSTGEAEESFGLAKKIIE